MATGLTLLTAGLTGYAVTGPVGQVSRKQILVVALTALVIGLIWKAVAA